MRVLRFLWSYHVRTAAMVTGSAIVAAVAIYEHVVGHIITSGWALAAFIALSASAAYSVVSERDQRHTVEIDNLRKSRLQERNEFRAVIASLRAQCESREDTVSS